jgi:Recombination endonuclease VII
MPRKQTHCARGVGHTPPCATPESMERQRQRGVARERVYDPDAARGWRSKHRLTRYGLTQETFAAMLEAQGYACAMCGELFDPGKPVFVDHDHNRGCHPEEKRACDRCRRGLLCLRCNTGLGYVERMGELAHAYLARVTAVRVVW